MKHGRYTALAAAIMVLFVAALTGCGSGSSPVLIDQNGRLVGNWGSKVRPTQMQLSSAGGQFNDLGTCFGGPLAGPVIPDAAGHFSVAGTYKNQTGNTSVHYTGTVTGSTMKVDVVADNNGQAILSLTLVFGQQPPSQTGGCPG